MISFLDSPKVQDDCLHRHDPEMQERLMNTLRIFFHGEAQIVAMQSSGDDEQMEDSLSRKGSSPTSPPRTKRSSRERSLAEKYVPTPPPPPSKAAITPNEVSSRCPRPSYLSTLDRANEYQEPLQMQSQWVDRVTHSTEEQSKTVQFLPQVSVVSIPDRKGYPKSVRRKLWTSFRALRVNGKRNVLEFEADNFDWRQCSEEDTFIAHQGELYHPETYRRRQCLERGRSGNETRKHGRKTGASKRHVSNVKKNTGPFFQFHQSNDALRHCRRRGLASLTRFADT
jgi:hypothetical protein